MAKTVREKKPFEKKRLPRFNKSVAEYTGTIRTKTHKLLDDIAFSSPSLITESFISLGRM